MDNHELAEMDAATRAIVRRAYELGRREALKRVVEVLETEQSPTDKLALMAPEKSETVAETATNGSASSYAASRSEKAPWWAWRVR